MECCFTMLWGTEDTFFIYGAIENKMFFIANTVTLVFDFVFLPTAIISYALIFCVYTQRQKKLQSTRSRIDSGGGERNSWQSFRKSRFYVSMLLIVTFVLFIIPADIIWMHYCLKESNHIVETTTTISYALSYLSDGIIYIIMNPKVKKLFIIHLQRIKLINSNTKDDAFLASLSEPSSNYRLSVQSTFISQTPRGSREVKKQLTVQKEVTETRTLVVQFYPGCNVWMNIGCHFVGILLIIYWFLYR